MQLAIPEQQLLQRSLDSIAKHETIGQDHGSPPMLLQELLDDQGHEHISSFAGTQIGGIVSTYTIVFVAAKGRIRDQAIHFLVSAPVIPWPAQSVAVLDRAGHI